MKSFIVITGITRNYSLPLPQNSTVRPYQTKSCIAKNIQKSTCREVNFNKDEKIPST